MGNKPILVIAIDSLGRFLMRAIAVSVVRRFCVCDCSGGSEAKTGDRTQISIQNSLFGDNPADFSAKPEFCPIPRQKREKSRFLFPQLFFVPQALDQNYSKFESG